MITKRPAGERGHFDYGWLDTRHSFSFAHYFDRDHMGFRSLRVINEDRVQPGKGFGTHPHRDMEIVTVVLSGALEHRDSLGNGSIIVPGEVQRMSAGTGIEHSEFNPSDQESVHFLQIWIFPDEKNLTPSYAQAAFEPAKSGTTLLAGPASENPVVSIHQNALLLWVNLMPDEIYAHPLRDERGAWIQIVDGVFDVNGEVGATGDGFKVESEPELLLKSSTGGRLLLFDLA